MRYMGSIRLYKKKQQAKKARGSLHDFAGKIETTFNKQLPLPWRGFLSARRDEVGWGEGEDSCVFGNLAHYTGLFKNSIITPTLPSPLTGGGI